MNNKELIKKIKKLKKEKDAVILVHNYQRPEIYDIADYIGDSYGLSLEAAKTKAKIIVFCGVHFMAESAAILNPGKKVLLPAINAGCPMADMVKTEDIKKMRQKYPRAAVVSYMNTTAETKAASDIICTSSNAVNVVNSLKEKQIIFMPDKNLAGYVAEKTDKEIISWNGYCYVHQKFSALNLKEVKLAVPNAEVIVHPECPRDIRELADHITSTSGMVERAKLSPAREFIIGTEIGMIEMLKREVPNKKFYSIPPGSTCVNMKKNTLELVLKALQTEKPVITVPENISVKAKIALDKMLSIN